MSWIDDGLKRDAQKKQLFEKAPVLVSALWDEIKARIDEAGNKGIRGLSVYEDMFTVSPRPPKAGQPETVRLELSDDRRILKAGKTGFGFELSGNEPSLVQNGNPISVGQAARLILEPYLFPKD